MIDFSKVKDYRVLLVGDAIMDEYIYVTTIGKAIKENALSSRIERTEVFRGGVWAAAEHTRNFCSSVDIKTDGSVMWNTRLVDSTYLRKLHVLHQSKPNEEIAQDFAIRDYDLVIVTDFGHGAVDKPLIERLTKEARFLAVNAQTNSSNFGFNMITKYKRADFVVIDEIEARLAAHDNLSPIEDIILALGYRNIIVTLGSKGAIGFDGAFERQKAATDQVVDTMGSGDAFLCVTSPFAAAGVSMKDLLRLGNAAGAIKCGIVGHRASVTKEELQKWL